MKLLMSIIRTGKNILADVLYNRKLLGNSCYIKVYLRLRLYVCFFDFFVYPDNDSDEHHKDENTQDSA